MKNFRNLLASWASSLTLLACVSFTSVSLYASDSPQIGIDSAGNKVAVWEEFDYNNYVYQIRAATYDKTQEVWTAVTNPISPATYSQGPTIAVNGAGNAIVAWIGEDPTTAVSSIQVAILYSGTWSTPDTNGSLTISPNNEYASSDYKVTIDTDKAFVVWSSYTDTVQVLRTATITLSDNTVTAEQLYP